MSDVVRSALEFFYWHARIHLNAERKVVAGALVRLEIMHLRLLAGGAGFAPRHCADSARCSGRIKPRSNDHWENKLIPAVHISQRVEIFYIHVNFFARLD